MAIERTDAEIAARFCTEQSNIQGYVELLLRRLKVTANDIYRVRGVLQSWKLISPRISRVDELNPNEMTPEKLLADFELLMTAIPYITAAIDEQDKLLHRLFGNNQSLHFTDHKWELVEYLDDHYADELLTLDIERLLEQCMRDYLCKFGDVEQSLDPDSVRSAIRYATGIRSIRKMRALTCVMGEISDIGILLRTSLPEAEINILRQGFILLMTTFDAAVFDLVRVKFHNNFFSLIGKFGKHDKISLKEIGEAGSFENVRASIIADQMKRRYVKDLLIMLETLGLKCTDESIGDSMGHLIEMVLRRNVHVHNGGIVDENYLEQHTNSDMIKPKYNVYKLNLGQNAVIDAAYWESANRITRGCIKRIADWVSI